ncbi:MAG: aldose 1-epimerase family protein [Lachnospiraceae bacterium]|nr:aldose 1-epimerase family protein [Lachnospiraceae bacterium]
MGKKELSSHVGTMQQLIFARPVTYEEGRARGMKACQVKNGPLEFTVMTDKCMDIAEASFCGHNVSFLSKPGLMGRNHFDTNGAEAQRSIMGGLLFTCGLENICAPCTIEGRDYPMHGRIRTTPAEHAGADACWQGENYRVTLTGEMREGELFGENLTLRRKISTEYGENSIYIEDIISNEGFRPEPMMLLYHINVGYPFLCETSQIILPTRKVSPRDEISAAHTQNYSRMESPKDNEPEYVFLHEMAADSEGNTFAAVLNEELGIGLKIEYNQKELPYFMQWKSTASGDYALGLEPANSSVYGKPYHIKEHTLHTMEPFAAETKHLKLTFLTSNQFTHLKEEAAVRNIARFA